MRGLKRKKIVIDVRLINSSGIGRYIREILDGIINLDSDVVLIGNKKLLEKKYRNENIKILNFNYSVYSILGQLLLPFVIRNCSIFWSPHFSSTFLPVFAKKRITTIHDTFHLSNRKYLNIVQFYYAKLLYFFAVLWSDDVITVSHFSAKELGRYFNVKNKLTVIYNGVDYKQFSEINEEQKFLIQKKYPQKYLLCVGNIKPHKNLSVVIEAFNKVILKDENYYLVIVGKKDGFINADTNLLKQDKKETHIIFTDFVEDAELISLYQNADTFIFPSLYEGFGLPPLEALAASTRVLVSKLDPMIEICGDRVEYFNPDNAKELADLILRKADVKIGKKEITKFLEQYSWKNSVKNHLIYFE